VVDYTHILHRENDSENNKRKILDCEERINRMNTERNEI
jgi:hypothetical protein